MLSFCALGARPPDPRASSRFGRHPRPPNAALLIVNFWLRACLLVSLFFGHNYRIVKIAHIGSRTKSEDQFL